MFGRKRYDEAETELVIAVTPELVAPLECGQVPPGGPGRFSDVPTDRELYHNGYLEVPFYGDHCIGPGCGPEAAVPGMPALKEPGSQLAPQPMPLPANGNRNLMPSPSANRSPIAPNGSPGASSRSGEGAASRSSHGTGMQSGTRPLWQPEGAPTPGEQPLPQGQTTNTSLSRPTRPSTVDPRPGLIAPRPSTDPFVEDLLRP
jgi:pilus assembly protein CpaC